MAVLIAACEGKADARTPDAKAQDAAAATASAVGAGATPAATPSPALTAQDTAWAALADQGRLMGRDSGAMWVVMVSDFQCPYCKMWHDSSFVALKRDYVDKGLVRLGYLNYPLPQHSHARNEAEASLCAGVQGKFWPFAEALFHEQAAIGTMTTIETFLDSLGRKLALDMNAFARCRKSPAIRGLVEADIQQSTRAQVQSTPTFIVGDFRVVGVMPYQNFRKAVDSALVVFRSKAKGTR
jgi:protein-disulfide isomerase